MEDADKANDDAVDNDTAEKEVETSAPPLDLAAGILNQPEEEEPSAMSLEQTADIPDEPEEEQASAGDVREKPEAEAAEEAQSAQQPELESGKTTISSPSPSARPVKPAASLLKTVTARLETTPAGAANSMEGDGWVSASAIEYCLTIFSPRTYRVVDSTVSSSEGHTQQTVRLGPDHKHIVMPILRQQNHWVVVFLDLDAKRALYVDSEARQTPIPASVKDTIRNLSAANPELAESEWEWECLDCVLQTNSNDCGVHVLVASLYYMYNLAQPKTIEGIFWRMFFHKALVAYDAEASRSSRSPSSAQGQFTVIDASDLHNATDELLAQKRRALEEHLRQLQAERERIEKGTLGDLTSMVKNWKVDVAREWEGLQCQAEDSRELVAVKQRLSDAAASEANVERRTATEVWLKDLIASLSTQIKKDEAILSGYEGRKMRTRGRCRVVEFAVKFTEQAVPELNRRGKEAVAAVRKVLEVQDLRKESLEQLLQSFDV